MNPENWGPSAWIFLHTITFNYPENPNSHHKQQAITFFNSLGEMLPCKKCQEHYQEYLNNHPVKYHVNTRVTLVKWLIDVHNNVNSLLGKKRLSYKEALKIYNLKANKNKGYVGIIMKCLSLLVIIIIIYYILKSKKYIY